MNNDNNFRIVASIENQPAAIDGVLKARLEEKITKAFGVRPERSGGGLEFWLLYRSEGYAFFMRRVACNDRKNPARGELRGDLSYLLNRISSPSEGDIFLDPFCGSGSIPRARKKYFPCEEIHAFDLEPQKNFKCGRADAFELENKFPCGYFNKIVTDPPWGIFGDIEDVEGFYEKMLKSFLRLVSRGGTIVVLTSQKILMRGLLARGEFSSGFQLLQAYDVLVNGKKAGVFVIARV